MKIAQWMHLVDSQTILGAIQKNCYSFQTFFANRIGEIQKAGPMNNWKWVEGKFIIADLITRGASLEELAEGSVWQEFPGFLKLLESEWPVKTARELNPSITEAIRGLWQKAFSAMVKAKAQLKLGPTRATIVHLVDPQRLSSLTRLWGHCLGKTSSSSQSWRQGHTHL